MNTRCNGRSGARLSLHLPRFVPIAFSLLAALGAVSGHGQDAIDALLARDYASARSALERTRDSHGRLLGAGLAYNGIGGARDRDAACSIWQQLAKEGRDPLARRYADGCAWPAPKRESARRAVSGSDARSIAAARVMTSSRDDAAIRNEIAIVRGGAGALASQIARMTNEEKRASAAELFRIAVRHDRTDALRRLLADPVFADACRTQCPVRLAVRTEAATALHAMVDSGIAPELAALALDDALRDGCASCADRLARAAGNGLPGILARHVDALSDERLFALLRAALAREAAPTPPSAIVSLDAWTPLLPALARTDHTRAISAVIAIGVDPDAAVRGVTPLTLAIRSRHHDAVHALLDGGANADARNADGSTPLMIAAATDNAELVTVLIAAGADPRGADVRNNNPLHYAARASAANAWRELVRHGADPRSRNVFGVAAATLHGE